MEIKKNSTMIRKRRIKDDILHAVSGLFSYEMLFRVALLALGSILSGIGATLAIKSSFGADSVALFWESLNLKFGVSIGTASYIFSLFFLILVFVIDKKYIGAGTVLSPIIQGITMDLVEIHTSIPENFLLKIIFMVLGIVILAIGCGTYAFANLGCGSYLGVILAGNKKWGCSITSIKWILDVILIISSMILGVFPSLGPVISVLISGFIIEITTKILAQLKNKIFQKKDIGSVY
ncbi:YitT family protein [Enterococcus faecium]